MRCGALSARGNNWSRRAAAVLLIGGVVLVQSGCNPWSNCVGTWVCATEINPFGYPLGCCEELVGPKAMGYSVSSGRALLVLAAAHVAGAQGTNWRSDVEVHSFGGVPATFTVYLLEHGADNSAPASREFTLGVGESLRLGDVIASEFGFEGQAALRIEPSSGRIMATSRTFNLLSEGNELGLPDGSTFGQYIPASDWTGVVMSGDEARLIQLAHSTDDGSGFRTNLGLVNARPDPITVQVGLYAAAGGLLGELSVDLAPYEYRQINRVFTRVTGDDVPAGYARVWSTSELAAFFAFASVVDNLTGDPVAVPAEAPGGRAEPVTVVAAAHVAGAADTNWRTDLEVHNPSGSAVQILIELLEHGVANPTPRSELLTLEAGQSLRLEDVLLTVFGVSDGAAALRITPDGGEVLVTSRTYNLLGEDNALGLPAGATFGQLIPGVRDDDAVHFGDEGRLIQLTHTQPAATGFRTNLILVNATSSSIDVEIDLYAGDGTHLGTVTRALASFEYRQLGRVFELVTADSVDDGYVVVRTTTEGGALFALASVVDNMTGDPVGMDAPRISSIAFENLLDDVQGLVAGAASPDIEQTMSRVLSLGVDGLIDVLVAVTPAVATRTGDSVTFDYGSGYRMAGETMSGTETWDLSGLDIGGDSVSGRVVADRSALLVDGEPPAVAITTTTLSLSRRQDGSVAGSIDVIGGAGDGKSSGTVSGWLDVDTTICVDYPISGTITVTHGSRQVAITFGPDCNGEVEHQVINTPPPSSGWDFEYAYWDPRTEEAQQYIVNTSNAAVNHDYYDEHLYAWTQADFGSDCVDPPPGVVTYHFEFPQPVLEAFLSAENRGRYLEDGVSGATTVRASNDGVLWQALFVYG